MKRFPRELWQSISLCARLVSERGLPLSPQNYVPALNQLASGAAASDAEAASRVLRAYQVGHLCVYDLKKHGFRHVFETRVAAAAPPVPGSRGGVAFVITNQTRDQLRALGHAPETVKRLRPAEALAAAEHGVGPDRLDDFLRDLPVRKQARPASATPAAAPSPPVAAPTAPAPHDMSAVRLPHTGAAS